MSKTSSLTLLEVRNRLPGEKVLKSALQIHEFAIGMLYKNPETILPFQRQILLRCVKFPNANKSDISVCMRMHNC